MSFVAGCVWRTLTVVSSLRPAGDAMVGWELIGIPLLALFRVTLAVLLARPCDRERAGGNVLRDDRSSSRVGVVPDRDWRHKRGIDTHLDSRSDRRAVLAKAVVLRGQRAGTDVALLADVGVPDVGQVGHFCTSANVRVLDLHERARLGTLAQDGAR